MLKFTSTSCQQKCGVIIMVEKRRYGLGRFLLDVLLTGLTGGFWLIWIFVREMRNR